MSDITAQIRERLFSLADDKYREFHSGLIPTADKDTFIGVRVPYLRALAKEYAKHEDIGEFVGELPHKYYDENTLHALIICMTKDYDEQIRLLDVFLPYVDNWATCDIMKPVSFKKNRPRLMSDIKRWLLAQDVYAVRFAIGMLMTHYLDEDFSKEQLSLVADIRSDEYYINMERAWYFATALAKQYDDTIALIEAGSLDVWTHNKTIQKARESLRISKERKDYLKSLKKQS